MQQAKMFNNGERVYDRITGDTGPCVYPALHLYLSSMMYYATNGGSDIMTGQVIYAGLYIVCQVAVMATYKAAHIPPIILPLLILSRRLHSIFVLRLFNDCWATTFFYLGVWAMCKGRWRIGSTLYSLALAVKMNILLYAPAMAIIYLRALGLQRSIIEALRVILIQVVLAFPFLRQDAKAYFSSAFDLSRQFLYKWTVNLRFLEEETFLDKRVARFLLGAHITVCAVWLLFRWTGISRLGLQWLISNFSTPSKFNSSRNRLPSGRFIVTALYTSNLIGITFSRSLHYQFYSWYAQQVPLLIYFSSLPRIFKILIPLCIELAWNTYPSTSQSSLLLLASHLVLLAGLWRAKQDDAILDENRQDEDKEAEELATQWDRKMNGNVVSQKANKSL
jgi:alpha-1,3-mannosyltransferase